MPLVIGPRIMPLRLLYLGTLISYIKSFVLNSIPFHFIECHNTLAIRARNSRPVTRSHYALEFESSLKFFTLIPYTLQRVSSNIHLLYRDSFGLIL